MYTPATSPSRMTRGPLSNLPLSSRIRQRPRATASYASRTPRPPTPRRGLNTGKSQVLSLRRRAHRLRLVASKPTTHLHVRQRRSTVLRKRTISSCTCPTAHPLRLNSSQGMVQFPRQPRPQAPHSDLSPQTQADIATSSSSSEVSTGPEEA